jgi:hypothetical protein
MKSPYKLKKEIEHKLFHGVVIPTAEKEGMDMSDQHKVVRMMEALVNKYHSMNSESRKLIIKKAETNMENKLKELEKKSDSKEKKEDD